MRSSSPRFDLFSDSSRQRSPLPPSRPKPILEPPVPSSAAQTRHYAIHTPGITTPVREEAGGAATPAPADFHIGNAADLRVPSTGTLRPESRGQASSIASTVLRKRAEVARKRAEAAALQLAAEEAELLALEASSQASRSIRREPTPGPTPIDDNTTMNLAAIEPKSVPASGPMSVLADAGGINLFRPGPELPADAFQGEPKATSTAILAQESLELRGHSNSRDSATNAAPLHARAPTPPPGLPSTNSVHPNSQLALMPIVAETSEQAVAPGSAAHHAVMDSELPRMAIADASSADAYAGGRELATTSHAGSAPPGAASSSAYPSQHQHIAY